MFIGSSLAKNAGCLTALQDDFGACPTIAQTSRENALCKNKRYHFREAATQNSKPAGGLTHCLPFRRRSPWREEAEDCPNSVSEPSPTNSQPACGRQAGDHRNAAGRGRHRRDLPFSPEEVFQLVDTRTAARILCKSANTLKRWRYEGIGPDYVAIEGRVSYDVRVLVDYVRRHTRVPSVRAQMEEDSREAL